MLDAPYNIKVNVSHTIQVGDYEPRRYTVDLLATSPIGADVEKETDELLTLAESIVNRHVVAFEAAIGRTDTPVEEPTVEGDKW